MSSHACRGKGINLMPDIPWYFYTEVKHSQVVPMEMLVEKRKEFLTVVYLVFEQRSTTVPLTIV